MTKLIIFSVFLLFCFFMMFLAHLLVRLADFPDEKRYLHIFYIVVWIIVMFVLFNRFLFSYPLLLVDKIINSEALAGFWNTVLPARHFETVYMVMVLVLTNFFVILGAGIIFLIVNKFVENRPFLDAEDLPPAKRMLHFPWLINKRFYRRDKDGSWHVKNRYYVVSMWIAALKNIFLGLFIAELAVLVVSIFLETSFDNDVAVSFAQSWYLLPMLSFILMEQIQRYLEGIRETDTDTITSEDIGQVMDGDLAALNAFYSMQYSDTGALMTQVQVPSRHILNEGLASNDADSGQLKRCSEPEILQFLLNQLKESGVRKSDVYTEALISLLNHTSINVREHIMGEFLPYLAAYMSFEMSQERTFLLLCKDETSAEEIRNAVRHAFSRINKLSNIWKVANIEEIESGGRAELLVCDWNGFLDHNLIVKKADAFRKLSAVIFTDCMEFCAQGNAQCELLFAELETLPQKLDYIVVSAIDNDSLRSAFESYCHEELQPFRNDRVPEMNYVLLWKEESCYKVQTCLDIGDDQSPYLGICIPIALTGIRADLPCVRIYCGENVGYHTYTDALSMSQTEALRYLEQDVFPQGMMMFNRFDPEKLGRLEMMVLYDEAFNIYNLFWKWIKYGGTAGTMVHIVSPPYMLREYFAANLIEGVTRNSEFSAMIPYHSGLRRTLYLELLLEMCSNAVSEESILDRNKEYGWGHTSVEKVLEKALSTVLPENEIHNIYECFRFEEKAEFKPGKGYIRRRVIRLIDKNIRERILEEMKPVRLDFKKDEEQSRKLAVPCGNITNYYLRGQIVPIGGYLCRILEVSDDRVIVDEAMPSDVKNYYPASEFFFSGFSLIDRCVDRDILDINRYTARAERMIYGYWGSNSGLNFTNDAAMQFAYVRGDGGEDQIQPILAVHESAQILEFRFRRNAFGSEEAAEKAKRLLGFMMGELFKTLFPYNYRNLFAVIEENPSDDYWNRLTEEGYSVPFDEKVLSLIPFCRPENTDPDWFTIRVVEFSDVEMGMVMALSQQTERLFAMMRDYLAWYIGAAGTAAKPDGNAENPDGSAPDAADAGSSTAASGKAGSDTAVVPSYLNFGYENAADCFDLPAVLAYCRKIVPPHEDHPASRGKRIIIQSSAACSFCGRTTMFPYRLDDQRLMCRSCRNQQVTQEDEVRRLLRDTVEQMRTAYRISFPPVHVALRSAESIRKKVKISGAGRVLGFYNYETHELWVERGGPANAVKDTMIHELTHAWQFASLDQKKLRQLQRKNPVTHLILVEGQTSFMETEVMERLGEKDYADYLAANLAIRPDEYGIGYRVYRQFLRDHAGDSERWTTFDAIRYFLDNTAELGDYISACTEPDSQKTER